jgi:hypothetical protein
MKSKNIHILPTDKPSSLMIEDGKLLYSKNFGFNEFNETKNFRHINNQNIYITSDEEITDYDWYISSEGKLLQFTGRNVLGNKFKAPKVILTTDQDLIKDGVQAIDDTFLEWFVKNPSCESVDVNIEKYVNLTSNPILIYKIIIPQKEDEQEVAERLFNNFQKENPIIPKKDIRPFKLGFIKGTKWQQEQNKNKYSEEEVIGLLNFVSKEYNISNGIGWFHTHESNEDISSKEVLDKFKKK